MIVFQLLLLVLLALPLFAGRIGLAELSLAYALVLVALAYKRTTLDRIQQSPAVVLLAFFGVLSLGISGALLAGVSLVVIAGGTAALLAVFFAALAWNYSTVSCELVGWTSGFAVVRIPPSLVNVMPAGVYAVPCSKKPLGKTVKVRFSLFDKKGKVV